MSARGGWGHAHIKGPMTGERAEAAEADEKKKKGKKIMAVSYRLYQNNREGKFKGMWYARASHNGTVDIDKLADIMQANCTVKRSDILAVLSELVEVMTDQLQNSMRVKLNGFGAFKIGLKTIPAATAKEFNMNNIKGMHVLFQPEATRQAGKRFYNHTFLANAKVREATVYDVDKGGDNAEGHDAGSKGNEEQSVEGNA